MTIAATNFDFLPCQNEAWASLSVATGTLPVRLHLMSAHPSQFEILFNVSSSVPFSERRI